MTLIDGDRIITAQLYNDEYEEFTEEKMSIIDYINCYTTEGVTETDVVMQTRWIPVSERLPENRHHVLFCDSHNNIMVGFHVNDRPDTEFKLWGTWGEIKNVRAWMPLPESYKGE